MTGTIKNNNKLQNLVHWFFSTYIGQRVLIFLAPFIMPPSLEHQKENLFVNMQIPYFAPTIGISFLFSAFLVLIGSLKRHGLDFTWLIQVESFQTKFKLFLCLLILAHAAAFARFLAPHLLNVFTRTKTSNLPRLSFWFSYYGGVAMVIGLFAWVIVLLAGLNLSWLGLLIALCVIAGLIFLARFELRRRYHKLHESLSEQETLHLSRFAIVLFSLLSLIGLGLIFYI